MVLIALILFKLLTYHSYLTNVTDNSKQFDVFGDTNRVFKGNKATVVDLSYGFFFFNESNVFQSTTSTEGGRKVVLQQYEVASTIHHHSELIQPQIGSTVTAADFNTTWYPHQTNIMVDSFFPLQACRGVQFEIKMSRNSDL